MLGMVSMSKYYEQLKFMNRTEQNKTLFMKVNMSHTGDIRYFKTYIYT